MSDDIVLQCSDLSKTFNLGAEDLPILAAIDFSVKRSEMLAIMGASGSGKSTLLQLLGGLDEPTSGEVTLLGQAFSAASDRNKTLLRNRHLGFVYQLHHLLPEFDACENVMMPLLMRAQANWRECREKAMQLLTAVGLADRARHRIGELSGGERQRVAIARALVTEPACVLADEPTGNLDVKTAELVFSLMCDLCQSTQTSFVIVTHNPLLASKMHCSYEIKEQRLLLKSAKGQEVVSG